MYIYLETPRFYQYELFITDSSTISYFGLDVISIYHVIMNATFIVLCL